MKADRGALPEKAFYKLGEVCEYTDTQPYVLRFWESEFPQLAPGKNRSGQRVYRRQDIDLILKIKRLLNEEEYTISEARRRLEEEAGGRGAREDAPQPPAPAPAKARSRGRLPMPDAPEAVAPSDTGAPDASTQTARPPSDVVERLERALAASEAERNASRARTRQALDRLDAVLDRLDRESSTG